jgi:hypothetical protein
MPPDAVFRRLDAFPPIEELLVQIIERSHDWNMAMLNLHTKPGKRIEYPGPPQFLRPGEKEAERKVETDPRVIARFFREQFGNEAVQH